MYRNGYKDFDPIVGKKRLFTINYRRSYPQNIKDYFLLNVEQGNHISFRFIFRISIPRKCCNKSDNGSQFIAK
jgi:hypothetical protein